VQIKRRNRSPKTKLLILVLIQSIIFLMSCDNPNDEIIQDGVLIPLEEGFEWNYLQTWETTSSNITAPDTFRMWVMVADTFDTFSGHYFARFMISPMSFGETWMITSNKPDGIYTAIRSFNSAGPTPPIIERALPYPTHVGERIPYDGHQVVTKSLSTSVTVPAGSFSCLWYEVHKDNALVAEYWIKPDIGIIKSWIELGTTKYYRELLDYELTNPL